MSVPLSDEQQVMESARGDVAKVASGGGQQLGLHRRANYRLVAHTWKVRRDHLARHDGDAEPRRDQPGNRGRLLRFPYDARHETISCSDKAAFRCSAQKVRSVRSTNGVRSDVAVAPNLTTPAESRATWRAAWQAASPRMRMSRA
jgi:hypothetical protein